MSKIRLLLLFAAVVIAAALIGKSFFFLAGFLMVAVAAFAISFKFLTVDRLEAKKNRVRVSDISTAIRGRAKTREDWIPDARVQGGMIFNKKKKRIEIAGRLSDDSLDRAFR